MPDTTLGIFNITMMWIRTFIEGECSLGTKIKRSYADDAAVFCIVIDEDVTHGVIVVIIVGAVVVEDIHVAVIFVDDIDPL